MAEPLSSGSDEKHGHASGTRTETLQECPVVTNDAPVLHLRLNQPKTGSKVKWTTDTVDNEFMGKKKSKCCCIFEKPKVFGESSSSEEEGDDDGCTDHCKGHKKKCYRKTPSNKHDHDHNHQGGAGPDSHDDSKTV